MLIKIAGGFSCYFGLRFKGLFVSGALRSVSEYFLIPVQYDPGYETPSVYNIDNILADNIKFLFIYLPG